MEELRILLQPWYLQIKFIHLLTVAIWSFSTAVAYRYYVFPAFRAWQRTPDNTATIARRNDAMERFDAGAVFEHVAFPVVLATGVLMVWVAGWSWQSVNWLSLKLAVVLVIFLPMELIDYYISHFGGNKRNIRASADTSRYEPMMQFHWRFFKVTTPLIIVFVPLVFYLAVTKPV